MTKRHGKAYFMISAVAQRYNIHPQTLRLYEREGLLKPSRTEGNTRLYSEEDLEQLETILALTRDLGVNLAGVEIILNMRRKMEQMQSASSRAASMIGSSVSELHSSKHRRPIWYVTRNPMQPSQNLSPRKKLVAHDLRSDDKIRSWSGGSNPSHLNQQHFTHTSERSQRFLH
jgi:MerR family transcriptional regulator, heat shock protein HspR